MDSRWVAAMLVTGLAAVGGAACGDGDGTESTPSSESPAPPAPTTPTTPTTAPLVEYEGGATYATGRIEGFTIDEGTVTTDGPGVEQSRDGRPARFQSPP